MFVTSRPHTRIELERILDANACDIMPFNEENQVDILIRFWKMSEEYPGQLKDQKLRRLAHACLKKLKTTITKEEGDMMGIPLQCSFLASVNLKNAKLYCSREDSVEVDTFVSSTSMYEIYTSYFNNGFEKATEPLEETDDAVDVSRKRQERKVLKAFHVWKALELLYPHLAEDYFMSESLPDRKVSKQILACGFLECSSGIENGQTTVEFFHRTLAEFLVSEMFVDIVTGQNKLMNNDKILTKFLHTFLQNFLHVDNKFEVNIGKDELESFYFETLNFTQVVATYFLNLNLTRPNISDVPVGVASYALNSMDKEHFQSVLGASINNKHVSIIRLLKLFLCKTPTDDLPGNKECTATERISKILELDVDTEETTSENKNPHFWSCCAYLYVAAYTSNVAVVKELYNLFEECLGENLNDICTNMTLEMDTPLHIALRRHDFSLAEFFVDKISLPHRDLLYQCIANTESCTQSEINEVIDICNLLIVNYSSIIYEETISITKNTHKNLINFLAQRLADASDINVLTHLSTKIDNKQLMELCRFFLSEKKSFHFFLPMLNKWDDPLPNLFKNIDSDLAIRILQLPGANLGYIDDDENNLIMIGIKKRWNVGVIKIIKELGVDPHKRNSRGEGCFHLAAKTGNVEMMQYFVLIGLPVEDIDVHGHKPIHHAPFFIDPSGKTALHHATEQENLEVMKYLVFTGHILEQRDKQGNTPLHYAKNNLDVVKYLISQNVDVCAVNNEGENIAHLAGSSVDGRSVVNYLVTLKAARKLFGHQNSSGKIPLHLVLTNGNILREKLEYVLSFPEVQMLIKNKDENLFLSAVEGKQNPKILQLLNEKGSNPFHVNSAGKTAVHLSVELGYLKAIKYLVSLGLSLEHRDCNGNTPLHYAKDKLHVVEYLVSQNVDILAVNKDGDNIAHQAANSYRSYGVIHYLVTLIDAPLLFRWSNYSGKTPLHLLLAKGVSQTTNIKLVLRLKLPSKSKENLFLDAIKGEQNVTILQLLKDKGADPYSKDSSGKTALHLAAKRAKTAIIEYLLSIGLALEDKDKSGKTPLMLSIINWDTTNLLISKGANVLSTDNDENNIAHLLVQQIFVKPSKFGNREFHRYLLFVPHGAELLKMTNKWDRTPLHDWIALSDQPPSPEIFQQLLEMSELDINKSDFQGNTMFLTAVTRKRYLPFLKTLIDLGANHNQTNALGENALHLATSAVILNDVEVKVLQYLVSIGCDKNHLNKKGESPYQQAVSLSRQNPLLQPRLSDVAQFY